MADPVTFTPAEREVLLALPSFDDDFRLFVRQVAHDCGLPVEQVRQVIRRFDALGWVTHGVVFNDNGLPNGSTWWLTERGLTARTALERTITP